MPSLTEPAPGAWELDLPPRSRFEPFRSVFAADDFGHLEDGQEHANDHATDHNAEKYNEDRFDERG